MGDSSVYGVPILGHHRPLLSGLGYPLTLVCPPSSWELFVKVLQSIQLERVADPVRSKFAMVVPVLEATLYSVQMDRIARLGGYEEWTLADLAREYREGHGDAGICFEFAIHEAIASNNPFIAPLAGEVLNDFCSIRGEADSIILDPRRTVESQSLSRCRMP
jgi:hypothetical protein